MKKSRCFKYFIVGFFWTITIVLFFVFFKRLGLSYNEEGNYFDEVACVVYHSQSIIFYGVLLFLMFIISVLSSIRFLK